MSVSDLLARSPASGEDILLPWLEFRLAGEIHDISGETTVTQIENWAQQHMITRLTPTVDVAEAFLLGFGRVIRALSDRDGSLESTNTSVTLTDATGYMSLLLHDYVFQYWMNRTACIWLQTVAGRNAGLPPEMLFQGVVRSHPRSGRTLTLQMEDYLTSSVVPVKEGLPKRRIERARFPGAPAGVIGWPEPIIYGSLGQGFGGSAGTPEAGSTGVVPCIPVGHVEDILGSSSWTGLMVCGHAVSLIHRVFVDGVDVTATINDFAWPVGAVPPNSAILAPGHIGYPASGLGWYRDIPLAGSPTRRYTILYVSGPLAAAVMEGTAAVTVDLDGIETFADGTGTALTLVKQYRHFILNWVINDYQSGSYASSAVWPSTVSMIDTASFNDVDAQIATVLGVSSPVYGGMMIGALGEIATVGDWVQRWNRTCGVRSGFSRHGGYRITLSVPGTPAFAVDDRFIVKNSVGETMDVQAVHNVVPVNYQRHYAAARWNKEELTVESPAMITAHRQRIRDEVNELWGVRDDALAEGLARHRLRFTKRILRKVFFDSDLRRWDLELGTTINVTTLDLPWQPGAAPIPLVVERVELDLDVGRVRVEGIDGNGLAVDYETGIVTPAHPPNLEEGSGSVPTGGGAPSTGVGPPGPAGPAGPTGPTGPTGPAGPPGTGTGAGLTIWPLGGDHDSGYASTTFTPISNAVLVTIPSGITSGFVYATVKRQLGTGSFQLQLRSLTTGGIAGTSAVITSAFDNADFAVTLAAGQYVLDGKCGDATTLWGTSAYLEVV